MKYELKYKVEVFNKHGKVIHCEERRSKSFLEGYAAIMCAQMHGKSTPTITITVTDTGGTERTLRTYPAPFSCNAGAGIVVNGIRVGTGDTAVDMTDNKLETEITEGTSTGEMEHQATAFTTPSMAGSTCSFTVARSVINSSGASITVKEVGVYGISAITGVMAVYLAMVRDVLVSSVAVPNGGGITVTYTVSATV